MLKRCSSGFGPLLYTIYINDISSSATNNPRLFADETCLILQDKDLNILYGAPFVYPNLCKVFLHI